MRVFLRDRVPDFMTCPPPGILGGSDGRAAQVTLNGETLGSGNTLDREGVIYLRHENDTITFDLPGGGYGDPALRDPVAVQQDLALGYITAEGVIRAYGIPSPRNQAGERGQMRHMVHGCTCASG